MNEPYQTIVGLIILFAGLIPIHEFGQWLMGKRLGLKNMKFGINKWHGIPWSVMLTGDFVLNVPTTPNGFVSLYKDLTRFCAIGSLFSVMVFLFGYSFGIFSADFTMIIVFVEMLYMIWEIESAGQKEVKA